MSELFWIFFLLNIHDTYVLGKAKNTSKFERQNSMIFL